MRFARGDVRVCGCGDACVAASTSHRARVCFMRAGCGVHILACAHCTYVRVQYPTGMTWDPAHDNIVIVSEKLGVLKKFNGWRGAGGQVLIDISAQVASYGDHGLTSVVYLNNYLWVTYMLINPEFGNNCNDYGQFDGGRQNADVSVRRRVHGPRNMHAWLPPSHASSLCVCV